MSLGVAVLGSTGSIGRDTLAVLDRHTDRYRITALTAHRSAEELARQVERYRPRLAVLADPAAMPRGMPASPTKWCTGAGAVVAAARDADADVVVNAVVGAAGLEATLAALSAGKRLALANKESLVAGGPLVLEALGRGGGELVPVDSEHSAILQCLRGGRSSEVRRLILTASGGPFRDSPRETLDEVTPDDALRHPTWSMGEKVTVDSATLANKALEVIEAHFLFGVPYDRIDVVVHPQSIIHSMVEFVDGSVVAQVGFPTMELPILYALTHPERLDDDGTRFDPVAAGELTFERVDADRFPAFRLGVEAGRAGGTAPAVFSAANEVAGAAFLDGRLPFTAIPAAIEAALEAQEPAPVESVKAVREADRRARAAVSRWVEGRC